MIVLIVERATPGMRGELSRWLLEPKSGVYVGRVSAMVRDQLWELVEKRLPRDGAAMLIQQSKNDQGYEVRSIGEGSRLLVDFEGLWLVERP